jgi:hypothetical protein
MQFYRNNGYVYDTLGGSEAHLMIGSVRITYDDVVYEGHIENLNYSFDQESPHRVQFDMEFTAGVIVDQSRASGAVAPMGQPTLGPANPDQVTTPAGAVASLGVAALGVAAARTSRRLETSSTPMGDEP